MYPIGCLNPHIRKGVRAKAIMEPSETYFENQVIVAQITAVMSPTGNDRARIVPTPDATDLPPVNPKNMDLLWPKSTPMAAITGVIPNCIYAFKKK